VEARNARLCCVYNRLLADTTSVVRGRVILGDTLGEALARIFLSAWLREYYFLSPPIFDSLS
jgi:hypothetical protein